MAFHLMSNFRCKGFPSVRKPSSLLQQIVEYQSARFTVGPFCMSGLLQLFVTPLSRLKCFLLCTHQGLLSVCAQINAQARSWQWAHECPRVCVPLYLPCVLEGQCQGAPLLSRASLQAMPRARKPETTSAEGNCVCLPARLHVSCFFPSSCMAIEIELAAVV